jgi:response regulator RpfG family c-di-GMP phosphodiesterase
MAEQNTQQDEDNWLLDDEAEPDASEPGTPPKQPWKILIVDDEKDVHTATRLAIQDIRYKDKGLALLYASSAQEGFEAIAANPDTALILLDVVMETDDAGLKLVHRIRNELNNQSVRIVLRTGQPGQAPEQEVILDYDINDYKTKTELTVQKLFTTVISSLRAHENLLTIEKNRQGLAKILEGAGDLYQLHSLKEFASGVLKQVGTLLDVGMDGILCVENGSHDGRPKLEAIAATGAYESLTHSNDLSSMDELSSVIQEAFRAKQSIYRHPYDVLYIKSQNGREFVVHFSPPWPLEDIERNLLEVFCQRISAAYDNLHLYNQLRKSQEATVVALADLAEFRDSDTGQHVLRVQKLVDALAAELRKMQVYGQDLSNEFMERVGMASILHDVGKVGTPDHILFKPGKLDPDERTVMEQHALIGAQILQKASAMVEGASYLTLGTQIAAGHHEHYDGHGYPNNLQGESIPLAARIVAVVDVFDALLNKRPYKEPWSLTETLDYIRARAGSQFDPQVVTALITLVEENRLPFELPPMTN